MTASVSEEVLSTPLREQEDDEEELSAYSRPITRSASRSSRTSVSSKSTEKKRSTADVSSMKSGGRSVGRPRSRVSSAGTGTSSSTSLDSTPTATEGRRKQSVGTNRVSIVPADRSRSSGLLPSVSPPHPDNSRVPSTAVPTERNEENTHRSPIADLNPRIVDENGNAPFQVFPNMNLKTVDTSLGLSRAFVLFVILLVVIVSVVRLDHDKHDTRGSICRSGRRMYSFFTLGFVKPWQWGVSREDIALVYEAEALLAQEQGIIASNYERFNELHKLTENISLRVQSIFDSSCPNVDKNPQRVTTHDVIERYGFETKKYRALRQMYFNIQSSLLPYAREIDPENQERMFYAGLENVKSKVENIHKNLCTIKSCAAWNELNTTLSEFNDNLSVKFAEQEVISEYRTRIHQDLSRRARDEYSYMVDEYSTMYLENIFKNMTNSLSTSPSSEEDVLAHISSYIEGFITHLINFGSHEDVSADTYSMLSKIRSLMRDLEYSEHSSSPLDREEIQSFCRYIARSLFANIKQSDSEVIDIVRMKMAQSTQTSTPKRRSTLINLALAPRGASVLTSRHAKSYSMLTSPPYVPSVFNAVGLLGGYTDAAVAISSKMPPEIGDCYAFNGVSGNLTIQLPFLSTVLQIGVYQKNDVNFENSALRSFSVSGWSQRPLTSVDPKIISQSSHDGRFAMGDFVMPSTPPESTAGTFRLFDLQYDHSGPTPVEAVTIHIHDNFGNNNFTCVYRIQLLGK